MGELLKCRGQAPGLPGPQKYVKIMEKKMETTILFRV